MSQGLDVFRAERRMAQSADLRQSRLAGVTLRPLPTDDPRKRRPDIDLARRLLNWTPAVPLDTGLMATVEYFRGFVETGGKEELAGD